MDNVSFYVSHVFARMKPANFTTLLTISPYLCLLFVLYESRDMLKGGLPFRHQQDITVHELMSLFENEHPSINVRQKSPWARGELRGQVRIASYNKH